MADTADITQARLQNITTVKPLLEALKTISLGAWQNSLRALSKSDRYFNDLHALYNLLPPEKTQKKVGRNPYSKPAKIKQKIVVIGVERGLCGKLNRLLVDQLINITASDASPNLERQIQILGTLTSRNFADRTQNRLPHTTIAFPTTLHISFVLNLVQTWLDEYQQHAFDEFHLVHISTPSKMKTFSVVDKLLPYTMPAPVPVESWPEPILDTPLPQLKLSLASQFFQIGIFRIFLQSMIAEHSIRYALMEEATRNADSLIEELNFDLQAARRHAITQEMTELAVGAGLLQ